MYKTSSLAAPSLNAFSTGSRSAAGLFVSFPDNVEGAEGKTLRVRDWLQGMSDSIVVRPDYPNPGRNQGRHTTSLSFSFCFKFR